MDESARIADQLARAFAGDPWWGPSTRDVLRGLDAGQAAYRPLPQAHTIWEIALHMTAWNREVLRRLRTGVSREPEDGDWLAQPEATEENWRGTVLRLKESFHELLDAAAAFPASRLDEVLGDERDRPLGSGVTFYVLLHGLVQHVVAHTAQMSLLKKAAVPG
jgi:uncharacterized damage-inducible protein DinB